jgi:gliding motility-associated lipoprotein GldH
MALALAGCESSTVYDRYAHTPLAGWEKNDTLTFDVSPVTASGLYHEALGVRINGAYPFIQLSVIVEQRQLPMGFHRADTLNLMLYDRDGHGKGRGVNYLQYNFPLTDLHLNRGDSLHVTIRHNMKREILPGIADVGFQLKAPASM